MVSYTKRTSNDTAEYGTQEFDKHRKLFIQNVPPVTHQDVRQYLGDIVPADIVISKRLQHVIITLKCSKDVDLALSTLKDKLLAGNQVQLELYPRRMMLYICGIPLRYTHEMYMEFLSGYGEVETAFLSRTQSNDNKGYGFVEFAHNRATLEQVRRQIHGSTLECSVLYCDLVPDTILSYPDTLSTTLYCVCECKKAPSSDQQLMKALQFAQRFSMADSRVLYILECPDVQSSEQLWYYSRTLAAQNTSSTTSLQYAMPSISPSQVANIISNTKRKYPTVDNKTETRFILLELFPDNRDLVLAIEKLLSQMESQLAGQPLTTNVLMNLANLLNMSNGPAVLPDTSIPPPTMISMPPPPAAGLVNTSLLRPSSTRPLQPLYTNSGPVTRSRTGLSSQSQNLIAAECEKRTLITRQTRSRQGSAGSHSSQSSSDSGSGDENSYGVREMKSDNTVIMLPVGSSCETPAVPDQHNHLRSCSGPMTRQRRRTLEKAITPYRKTPGTKGSKKERPVVFEVDLNYALTEMFTTRRQTMSTTPNVLRKLLPEPEASPETPRYIGQHSQGIGGHYADSYIPSTLRSARILQGLRF